MGRASPHLERMPSLTMGRSGPLKRLNGVPALAHVQRERIETVAHHCAETLSSRRTKLSWTSSPSVKTEAHMTTLGVRRLLDIGGQRPDEAPG
jgi:hypothetical protein